MSSCCGKSRNFDFNASNKTGKKLQQTVKTDGCCPLYFEFAIALLRPGRVFDLIEFQNTQSLSSTKSQILHIKKSTEIHQKILKKFRLFFDSEGPFWWITADKL